MRALACLPSIPLGLLAGCLGGALFIAAGMRVSPLMAAAAMAGIGLVLLLLRDPVLGLYILAAVVPIERFGRLSDDTAAFEISIMRMIGMLAFAVLFVHILVRRREPIITAPLALWTLYVAFAFISLTYSSDVKGGIQITSGSFGNILFLFSIASLVCADTIEETARRAHVAILIWLLASTAVAAYSIYDWHFGSGIQGGIPIDSVDPQAGAQLAEHRWATVWEDTAEQGLSGLSLRRSMGPTSHAAVFGINLLMSIPFFLYAMRTTRSAPVRLLLWLGLAGTLYCVLLTNTRAVVLLAALTLAMCVFARLLPLRPWMLIGGLLAGGIALFYLPGDIFNRILNSHNYAVENSEAMRVRLEYWDAGLRAILDNWLTGVGVGNRLVMLSYLRHPIEGHSTMHNIYLQTALDLGLVGWLAFVAFLGSVLLWTDRLRRRLRALGRADEHLLAVAAEILVITVLVFGMQVDVFFFPLKAWWLIIGIVIALDWRLMRSHPALAAAPRLYRAPAAAPVT